MTGHICPECGTDNRPGTGPGCACAARPAHGGAAFAQQPAGQHHLSDEERAAEQQRIAEQHHAERSAEMAAAEDFDPLRIRPYVTLGGEDATAAAAGPSQEQRGHAPGGQAGDAATTMPLFLGPAGPGPVAETTAPAGAAGFTGTALLTTGPDPVRPRRRRPFAALVAGAAVVTVVGTAAFVGGLFNGDGDREADLDQALPSTVASLPDEDVEPSASASASASPSASRSASRSPSASAAESGSASASASTSPSASASRSASASASRTTAASSPAATAGSSNPAALAPPAEEQGGPTLRRGDHGPEVAELQERLQAVGMFRGQPVDADYTDRLEIAVRDFQRWWGVDGDPEGVYGPHTRHTLELYTPHVG